MKRILIALSLLCGLAFTTHAEEQWDYNIPAGTTLYLDVTQYWCCMESYLIYTYDGWYAVMTPVPGKHGLYQYTLHTTINNPDIRFMACATTVAPGVYSGWPGNLYVYKNDNGIPACDPRGGKVYAIITSQDRDNSKGRWDTKPTDATGEEVKLTDVTVLPANTDCVDKTFDLDITATWTGMACKIGIESTLLKKNIVRNNIQSPYTYTIPGLDGTIGTQSITIKLLESDGVTVVDQKVITVTPPDLEHCGTRHEVQNVCLDDFPITLQTSITGDEYEWSHDATNHTDHATYTTTKAGTTQILGKVYKPHLDASDNLMLNADFEQELNYGEVPPGMESDYTQIPTFDPEDVYASGGYGGWSGVYMISHNAQYTWRNFLNLDAHGGKYFALFDANESGDAWRATSAKNPALKVEAGERYKFSCWAVNINDAAYGDDGHPAKLQFYIEYNGTKVKLGSLFPLAGKHDWVYYEAPLWTAPVTTSNVTISVTDEESYYGGGNDFGLDDIMFQKITSEKLVLAYTDTFDIKALDCSQFYDTICLGEIYDKDNFYYETKPEDGGKEVQVTSKTGEFILNLFVIQPAEVTLTAPEAICNFQGGTIGVAYSVVKGEPVSYTVAFSDPSIPAQPQTAWTADSLYIKVDKFIAEGDITATVTVMDKSGRCPQDATVTLSFLACNVMRDTICPGDIYDKDTLGTHFHYDSKPADAGTIVPLIEGNDRLYLYVIQPIQVSLNAPTAICNFAGGTIQVPYTQLKGEPLSYTVTFSADSIPEQGVTTWTADALNISIPKAISKGQVTATLTINEKYQRCPATADVTLSFVECKTLQDTACQNEPFDDGQFHSACTTPGIEKLVSGYDTMYLYVIEQIKVGVDCPSRSVCGEARDLTVDATFQKQAGVPYSYTITYSAPEMKAVEETRWSSSPIKILVPAALVDHPVTATLTVYDQLKRCPQIFTFTVLVSLNAGVPIYRKWDNVLFVSNEKDEFIAYQWYRDNLPISGATEQALYTGVDKMQGDNHSYSVIVTRLDGTTIQSCEYFFEQTTPSAPLNPGDRKAIQARKLIYQVGPAMQIIETTYEDGTTDIQKVIAL